MPNIEKNSINTEPKQVINIKMQTKVSLIGIYQQLKQLSQKLQLLFMNTEQLKLFILLQFNLILMEIILVYLLL